MSYEEVFKEEEELRLGLKDQGHEHDCLEAGCTLDPKGQPIVKGKEPRRRKLTPREKELLKKLRGITVE